MTSTEQLKALWRATGVEIDPVRIRLFEALPLNERLRLITDLSKQSRESASTVSTTIETKEPANDIPF